MDEVTSSNLSDRVRRETSEWEKRKEKVMKWGEQIDMRSTLAPSSSVKHPEV